MIKERYKEMHNIKYEKELDIGSAAHIRVYRNRGKNLIAVHPFLLYRKFRVLETQKRTGVYRTYVR